MSEGQKFEIPPKSNEPQSEESILERGEIKSARELEGYWGMQLVEIKDDGDALFRPDKETDYLFESQGMEARRSDLELMAYKIDQALEFNMVPVVAYRAVGENSGSIQRRIKNFYDGHDAKWGDRVNPEEMRRAAIFDYLVDVRDRHSGNFVIDSDTNKLWLIDHDFYMFFKDQSFTEAHIVTKAKEKRLTTIGTEEVASLERFLAQADSLVIDAKPEIVEIIKKAQDRARILLKEGQIPTTI